MMIIGMKVFITTLLTLTLGFKSERERSSHPVFSISQVDSIRKVDPKFSLVLVSTDWCSYCLIQDRIIRKLSSSDSLSYHIFKLNAEFKEAIQFNGNTYHFQPNGTKSGIHELARILHGPGSISFPFWVILDKDLNVIDRFNGVLKEKQLVELSAKLNE
jgi:thioredoxin-related protein